MFHVCEWEEEEEDEEEEGASPVRGGGFSDKIAVIIYNGNFPMT